ncbi:MULTISPECIES: C-GCAxxG-C-C family protein [unclassified Desulfovibrio]|uniref:C-GCAxxG-C-C family protein n=1 Tax=unclassified Desulfovibrio TaxID=2593640 RepID=UPI002FDA93DA
MEQSPHEGMELAEAQENFGMGIICAQQVFAHFSERFGLSPDDAMRAASCFGSGMGQAATCGCVTGALMALGMAHGCAGPCSRERKGNLYSRRDAFMTAFVRAHGSLLCREILGHDLTIPQERALIMEKGLFTTVCAPLVCAACDLLEEYL